MSPKVLVSFRKPQTYFFKTAPSHIYSLSGHGATRTSTILSGSCQGLGSGLGPPGNGAHLLGSLSVPCWDSVANFLTMLCKGWTWWGGLPWCCQHAPIGPPLGVVPLRPKVADDCPISQTVPICRFQSAETETPQKLLTLHDHPKS